MPDCEYEAICLQGDTSKVVSSHYQLGELEVCAKLYLLLSQLVRKGIHSRRHVNGRALQVVDIWCLYRVRVFHTNFGGGPFRRQQQQQQQRPQQPASPIAQLLQFVPILLLLLWTFMQMPSAPVSLPLDPCYLMVPQLTTQFEKCP